MPEKKTLERAGRQGLIPRRHPVNVVKVVQFITLLLFSLVTGVFWGTWFSLSRSIAAITPATFLEVGRLMIGNLGGPMSVLMPGALLSAIVLGVLLYRRRQTQASMFTVAAFALMVVALIITLAVNVPIDRQILSWTTGTLPPDWSAIRDRWEFYHGLRTLISLFALACLFAGTLSTGTVMGPARDQQGGRDEQRGSPRSTAA
jgi:uncharacterized membrane protein